MTNYFNQVLAKSSFKSSRIFSCDDSEPQLLIDYYNERSNNLSPAEILDVTSKCEQWLDFLLKGFNVIVFGTQSRRQWLDTFHVKYLCSGNVRDYKLDGSPKIFYRVVKLHGFTPVTLEKFTHAMFGITDSRRHNSGDISKFLDKIEETQTHYFFVMHSIDLLLKECLNVCQLIFELFGRRKDLIHIIASADHFNIGKIIQPYRFQLKFVYFWVEGTTSFLMERMLAQGVVDENLSCGGKKDLNLFSKDLDLSAIRDVFTALQPKCKWVMLYILRDYVLRYDIHQAESKNDSEKTSAPTRSVRKSTRVKQLKKEADLSIEFNELLRQCQKEYIRHSSQLLRDHLGELSDHRIVSIDEAGHKVRCLVEPETCRRLLEFAENVDTAP